MACKVASLSLRRREPLGPAEEARKRERNRGSRWRDGQLLRCDTVARTGAQRCRGPTRPLGLSNRAGFYPVKPPAHQGQGMGEVPRAGPLGPSWSAPPTAREVLAGSRKDLQELMYVQAALEARVPLYVQHGGAGRSASDHTTARTGQNRFLDMLDARHRRLHQPTRLCFVRSDVR